MLPNIAETTTNKQQSFDSMKPQTQTGILYGSVPGHTAKLIAAGLVVKTNNTRTTANGCQASVLVAASFAQGGEK